MSWGSTFRSSYDDASPQEKAQADQSLSSLDAAGQAIARTANTLAQVGGEVVNTAVGLATALALSLYGAAKRLFTDDPSPVRACPTITCVDVTTNDYRKSLVNLTFDGSGDRRLAEAMNALREPLSDAQAEPHLATIAELRKRPLDELREEYKTYAKKRDEQEDRIAAGSLQPIDELKPSQSDFMGSDWQLRYGKVVGDQMGVDPVFGAMLNPTGGLVGPGQEGKDPDSWYMPEAVAYHGAYHDAMGYLYNYQNFGPGYNYMDSPIGLATDNPYAGQATGVAQWAANLIP